MIYKGKKNNDMIYQSGDMTFDSTENAMMIWDGIKWVYLTPSDSYEIKRNQIIKDFEDNPDLYEDVMVEFRKRKIEKIIK